MQRPKNLLMLKLQGGVSKNSINEYIVINPPDAVIDPKNIRSAASGPDFE